MASKPSYDELAQQVAALSTQIQQMQKQVKAKDAKGLVPTGVKVEQPAVFKGIHNGTAVRNFVNACEAYFQLVGLSDENTRALFAQMRLVETARTWYDGQGYAPTQVTWTQLRADLLGYFVPVDQARRARRVLMSTKQGKRHVQAYIDEFRKALLDCTDVEPAEAKFVFESNLADWLASLVLPHQCQTLRETVLCAQSIGSIERVQHSPVKYQPRTEQGPTPMVLGTFQGTCHRCGKTGHKKAQCRVHPKNFVKNAQAKGKQNIKDQQPKRSQPKATCFNAVGMEASTSDPQNAGGITVDQLAVQVSDLAKSVQAIVKND